MYKKKEIIIIIFILIASISLAFLPNILSNIPKDTIEVLEENTNQNTIKIHITGEIKEDFLDLEVPYGSSYGYIISKIDIYLNSYSIIDKDFKKRYFEDSNIIIESLDIKIDVEEDKDTNKIKISIASKNELITLYGIGEKRAEAIIKYREEKEIESWDELRSLLGVSNEVIQAIKEKAIL